MTTSPPAAVLAGRPAAPAAPATRLRWLDALRGIAVLAVVYEHFGSYLVPDVKLATTRWVHAGTFGVMLFFLVSGYMAGYRLVEVPFQRLGRRLVKRLAHRA